MLPLHATPGDQIEPFTPLRLLTAWTFEPVLLGVIVILGGLYLYGVHKLRKRGDKWSRGRTFSFVGGRTMIRAQATQAAMDRVRRMISV